MKFNVNLIKVTLGQATPNWPTMEGIGVALCNFATEFKCVEKLTSSVNVPCAEIFNVSNKSETVLQQ